MYKRKKTLLNSDWFYAHQKKLGYFKVMQRAFQEDSIIPQLIQDTLQFFLTVFATPTYLTQKYGLERIKLNTVTFNDCFFFPFLLVTTIATKPYIWLLISLPDQERKVPKSIFGAENICCGCNGQKNPLSTLNKNMYNTWSRKVFL